MPSSTTLQHAIENITIWRKGEQRAPHKPLLLLYVLSQYQRGHARMFDYASEIRDELHSLLERFGPQRRQYRPDMPFWRLKGDGFWELHNSEQCSTGAPTAARQRAELCHVAGGFDEPHFALLNRNKKLINTLAHQILEAHFRRVFRKTAEEMGFDLLRSQERDPHFRQQVLRAYECAICGFNMRHDNTSVARSGSYQMEAARRPLRNLTARRSARFTIRPLIKAPLVWMRICASGFANGERRGHCWQAVLGFDGKPITLPRGKNAIRRKGFVAWHRRGVQG